MIPDAALEAGIAEGERTGFEVRAILRAALPHLLTDEMVERAAEAIAAEFGYALSDDEETYDAAYWKRDAADWERLARRALEAALGGTA